MNKSLIIIKPGFDSLVDEVINEYAKLGYTVINRKSTILTQAQCDVLWSDLRDLYLNHSMKQRWIDYCDYVTSGEVECLVIENSVDSNYDDILKTKYRLRKKFQVRGIRDLLHSSDSNEDAEIEIACIF